MGILNGTATIVDKWLGLAGVTIGVDPQFKHLTTLINLADGPFRTMSFNLPQSLLDVVYRNVLDGTGTPGQSNWEFRRVPDMDGDNGAEVTLERTLIQTLEKDGPRLWGNMCPVASGVHEPAADGRMAVDLVEVFGSTVTLIELKIRANTALYAAIEVLGYGLCYMIARALPGRFQCNPDLPMFHNKLQLQLRVLAPQAFYGNDLRLTWLKAFESRINDDLRTLDLPFRYNDCQYSVDFGFQTFPIHFNWDPALVADPAHRAEAIQSFLNRHPPFPGHAP